MQFVCVLKPFVHVLDDGEKEKRLEVEIIIISLPLTRWVPTPLATTTPPPWATCR
jgi:hypothetical protein